MKQTLNLRLEITVYISREVILLSNFLLLSGSGEVILLVWFPEKKKNDNFNSPWIYSPVKNFTMDNIWCYDPIGLWFASSFYWWNISIVSSFNCPWVCWSVKVWPFVCWFLSRNWKWPFPPYGKIHHVLLVSEGIISFIAKNCYLGIFNK